MNWEVSVFAGLRPARRWWLAVATATVVTALCRPVWAYTPNSPEVREMLGAGSPTWKRRTATALIPANLAARR